MVVGALAGGNHSVDIVINAVDNFSGTFNDAKQETRGLTGYVKRNQEAILGMGAAMTGAGVLGVAAIGNVINETSAVNESVNAVTELYGKNADEVLKIGRGAAKSMGMSRTQFNMTAVQFSAFADMIAGKGGDVVNIVENMTTRASDFASMMDLPMGSAIEKFMSGLAGETEVLRDYGINVSAARTKLYAWATGITKAGEELTMQQKIVSRYGLIMKQTERYAGDFVRTSDQWANSQRILQATTTNLKASLGEDLMPMLIKLLDKVQQLVDWFNDLSEGQKEFIIKAGAVATVLALVVGPILLLIGMLPAIASGLGMVAAGLTATTIAGWPLWAIILAIIAVVAIVIVIVRNWGDIMDWLGEKISAIGEWIGNVWDAIKSAFSAGVDFIKKMFLNLTPLGLIIKHWEPIKNFFGNVWQGIKDIFNKGIDFIKKMFLNLTPIGLIIKHWEPIKEFFGNIWQGIKDVFNKGIDFIKKMFLNLTPIGLIIKHWEPIKDFFKDLWEGIKNVFKKGINFVVGLAEGFANIWVKAANTIIGALNSISVNIPDWVPFLGGKTFGVNISKVSEVNLSALKIKPVDDFILTKERELIQPSKNDTIIGAKDFGNMGTNYNFEINIEKVSGTDPDEMAEAFQRELKNRIGVV